MILKTSTTGLPLDTTVVEDVAKNFYDAIIVGGGLAGLVAAARLSEDATRRVLVIDAGVDRRGDFNIDTPGMLEAIWGNPVYDWDFYSEPQPFLNGRQVPQPRGRVLGGSSAINALQLVYPSQRDFDAWSKVGSNDWTHETLLPYYRMFHKYTSASSDTKEYLDIDSFMDPSLQGDSGPVQASHPDVYIPFNKAWIEAFESAGLNNKNDPILGKKLGAFHAPNTVDPKTKKRSYAASTYLNSEVESRPNLDLLTETRVTKVLLEKRNDALEATGVQIHDKSGRVHEISAREVILAAGAFQSPQILEQSGIGSREILSQYGIEALVDNPGVGENLQDHAFTTVLFEVADDQMSGDVVRHEAVVQALVQQYVESHSGPLSGLPMSLAYTPPVDIDGVMKPSDLETLVRSHLDRNSSGIDVAWKAQYDELKDIVLDPRQSTIYYALSPRQMHVKPQGKTSLWEAFRPELPQDYIAIFIGLNHPFSRGSVHIGSSDPLSNPVIDPRYLSHPIDLELLARATQFVEKIAEQPAMASLLKPKNRFPALAKDLQNLDVAKQITKERLWTNFHPSCTCPMLPKELGGVVNERLTVHGTSNLRVIDASVFPMITSGNIQATVYAVAERACDLIKGDWAKLKIQRQN